MLLLLLLPPISGGGHISRQTAVERQCITKCTKSLLPSFLLDLAVILRRCLACSCWHCCFTESAAPTAVHGWPAGCGHLRTYFSHKRW